MRRRRTRRSIRARLLQRARLWRVTRVTTEQTAAAVREQLRWPVRERNLDALAERQQRAVLHRRLRRY